MLPFLDEYHQVNQATKFSEAIQKIYISFGIFGGKIEERIKKMNSERKTNNNKQNCGKVK